MAGGFLGIISLASFHFSIVKGMFKGKMSRREDNYLLRGNDRSRFFSGVNAILLVC